MPVVRIPPEGELVYQLKISLKYIKPEIWRRVQIANLDTLRALHHTIQGVFRWDNSHLHDFQTPLGVFGGVSDFASDWGAPEFEDEAKVPLHEAFAGNVKTIQYTYDFGDGWDHVIRLERRLKPEPGAKFPVVIAGENAAPFEDCGGPPGYMRLVEIVERGPRNADEEDILEWAGGIFDPEEFDLKECNRRLAKYFRPRVFVRASRKKSGGK